MLYEGIFYLHAAVENSPSNIYQICLSNILKKKVEKYQKII